MLENERRSDSLPSSATKKKRRALVGRRKKVIKEDALQVHPTDAENEFDATMMLRVIQYRYLQARNKRGPL